jgi:hypothetical protein
MKIRVAAKWQVFITGKPLKKWQNKMKTQKLTPWNLNEAA